MKHNDGLTWDKLLEGRRRFVLHSGNCKNKIPSSSLLSYGPVKCHNPLHGRGPLYIELCTSSCQVEDKPFRLPHSRRLHERNRVTQNLNKAPWTRTTTRTNTWSANREYCLPILAHFAQRHRGSDTVQIIVRLIKLFKSWCLYMSRL